jgi:serine/threonine-protein kinase
MNGLSIFMGSFDMEHEERLKAALADRYAIEREIGSGGMATVFLAQDLRHDRHVALKVLKPELAAVLGAERFVQEIKTTANLQHPHILPLFDSGEADSFLYYVMPYIDGETLRGKLDRETQLGIEEAVRITSEVADALDYAHRHNVIHRDIKPENILLHDGRPMVADFGIALAVSAAAGGRMTETGLSLGTPYYMSPEQATAEKELTNRSDIYSLGAMLYEMLTGNPPHIGSSAQQIIMKIVTDEARPVTELRKTVPQNVAAATTRALEKLPADRFESAARFVEALENPAFGLSTTGPSGAPDPGARKWKPLAIAASALALVFLATTVRGWLGQAESMSAVTGSQAFTFDFWLDPAERVAVDMDQLLFDVSDNDEVIAWIGPGPDPERQVFYRFISDTEVRPVPETEGLVNVWLDLSPDGRQVSFMRDDELLVVPLDGSGQPQLIFSGPLWSWTWADDGSFVVAEPYRGLSRVAEPGATPEPLTSLEGDDVTHQYPQVLPDGRTILFSVGSGHFHSTHIEVLIPDADTVRRESVLDSAYSATYVTSGHLVFGHGDRVLAAPFDLSALSVTGPAETLISDVQTDFYGPVTEFAVSRRGTLVYLPEQGLADYRLAWAREGGGIDWLEVGPAPFFSPRVSPDGESVAVSGRLEGDRQGQIYTFDFERPIPQRRTDGYVHDFVVWSPEGDELLFNSSRGGNLNLFRMPVSGTSQPTRVSTRNVDQAPTDWSSDGQLVFYERLPYDIRRISMLSLHDSTSVPTVLTPEGSSERFGSIFGDWLAFQRGGQVFVRSLPIEGRETLEEQVSGAGGQIPMWLRDGSAILYLSPDRRRVLAVDVDTSAGLRLGQEREFFVVPDGVELNPETFDVGPDDRLLLVAREIRTGPQRVVVSMNQIGR